MKVISVIIPTYNRCTTLVRCLNALEHQTLDRSTYEIIVVDDGSTDDTALKMQQFPNVRYLRQPRNAGPSAARNRGVQEAEGQYILFMGDDTIARPQVLKQHVQAHAETPGDEIAVLGYAPWCKIQEITPLMRYLFEGRSFQQFRYHAIRDIEHVPYGFFYTCNLSISRAFLLQHGLFDEEFRYAYGEDTELAYRLQRQGMRMVFRKHIVADHFHPTSYRNARRRTRLSGNVAVLMAQKHPELSDVSFVERYSFRTRASIWIKRRATEWLLDPLLEYADRKRWDYSWLARTYDWALRSHQLWGLIDALKAQKHQSQPAQRFVRQGS